MYFENNIDISMQQRYIQEASFVFVEGGSDLGGFCLGSMSVHHPPQSPLLARTSAVAVMWPTQAATVHVKAIKRDFIHLGLHSLMWCDVTDVYSRSFNKFF